jgi:hypothetical protein
MNKKMNEKALARMLTRADNDSDTPHSPQPYVMCWVVVVMLVVVRRWVCMIGIDLGMSRVNFGIMFG